MSPKFLCIYLLPPIALNSILNLHHSIQADPYSDHVRSLPHLTPSIFHPNLSMFSLMFYLYNFNTAHFCSHYLTSSTCFHSITFLSIYPNPLHPFHVVIVGSHEQWMRDMYIKDQLKWKVFITSLSIFLIEFDSVKVITYG